MRKINSNKVFIIARKHLDCTAQSHSARYCMADAMRHQNEGNLERAVICALRSIAHSVGILHPDYARAFKASGISGDVRLVS